MIMLRAVAFAGLMSVMPVVAPAQTPKPVTKESTVTGTARITAIDQKTRSMTLRYADGTEESFTVGPEVTRFDQFKVGDSIRATYTESIVLEVRKPGAPAPAADAAVAAGRLKQVPGAAAAVMQTTAVTVKAVDMAKSTITVTTKDGMSITRKAANPKNLEGVKVGDTIDIYYAQGLILNLEAAK
jgi:hypothetical protein